MGPKEGEPFFSALKHHESVPTQSRTPSLFVYECPLSDTLACRIRGGNTMPAPPVSRPIIFLPFPVSPASQPECHPSWESRLRGPLLQEAFPDVFIGLVAPPHFSFPLQGSLYLLSSFAISLLLSVSLSVRISCLILVSFYLFLSLSRCLSLSFSPYHCLRVSLCLLLPESRPFFSPLPFSLFPCVLKLSPSPCLSL